MDLSCLQDIDVKVTPHAQLKEFTTFQLGGPCLAMIECPDAPRLIKTVKRLRENKIPFLMMGFGSNILASDEGIDSVIVRYHCASPRMTRTNTTLCVDACAEMDQTVLFSIQEGLDGLLLFSGIPGTVGGAIAGNAGAYGACVSDVLKDVTLLKADGQVVTIPKGSIRFDYRDSEIKHTDDIILSATFNLAPGKDPQTMRRTHDSMIATRQEKHGNWRTTPSAGSFFRNVLPSSKAGKRESAGWFLEQAGAKTIRVGQAHCHDKHANIITRDHGGTAQDVYLLTERLAELVKEKFQISLSREVRLLGRFTDTHASQQKGYW